MPDNGKMLLTSFNIWRKENESENKNKICPKSYGTYACGQFKNCVVCVFDCKHEGGDFILRIEDTDQERYVEGAVDIIYRTLDKTGLVHDEGPDKDGGVGPYVQSERQAAGIYLDYAKNWWRRGRPTTASAPRSGWKV